jgi:hypothetical protein
MTLAKNVECTAVVPIKFNADFRVLGLRLRAGLGSRDEAARATRPLKPTDQDKDADGRLRQSARDGDAVV